MEKRKIGILGMGGVGGFIGGKLALHFSRAKNTDMEVIFIARGETEKVIRENGLKLIVGEEETIIRPDIISSDPEVIGSLEILICATKSYDLEESLRPLAPCISRITTILPLLNGVDATPRIREMYPVAHVLDGCIYIMSQILERGVIKTQAGEYGVYFGGKDIFVPRLEFLQRIMMEAGISTYLFPDAQDIVWEKFIFISAIGSLTCYLDQPIGAILEKPEYRLMLQEIVGECFLVARVGGVVFDDEARMRIFRKLERLPYETTSSMYRDFKKGGKTEYKSLVEYVVLQGDKLNINTPVYDKVLKMFVKNSKGG